MGGLLSIKITLNRLLFLLVIVSVCGYHLYAVMDTLEYLICDKTMIHTHMSVIMNMAFMSLKGGLINLQVKG